MRIGVRSFIRFRLSLFGEGNGSDGHRILRFSLRGVPNPGKWIIPVVMEVYNFSLPGNSALLA